MEKRRQSKFRIRNKKEEKEGWGRGERKKLYVFFLSGKKLMPSFIVAWDQRFLLCATTAQYSISLSYIFYYIFPPGDFLPFISFNPRFLSPNSRGKRMRGRKKRLKIAPNISFSLSCRFGANKVCDWKLNCLDLTLFLFVLLIREGAVRDARKERERKLQSWGGGEQWLSLLTSFQQEFQACKKKDGKVTNLKCL